MIQLKNVSVGYVRRQEILHDITIDFAPKRIHGLFGRNGIGKSTLLKCICGLMTPHRGEVTVDGENSLSRRPSILQKLFIVPEDFELPGISLNSYCNFTAPFYPTFSDASFINNCAHLEVNPTKRLSTMSMGERKKAYLAFALACQTPYLLLDEPTNGLDIPSKTTFRGLLAAQVDLGQTIIISTHQIGDVGKLIDNVVILDAHGVAFNAPVDQISSFLHFGVYDGSATPLYTEESFWGKMAVTENKSGTDSEVDMSLLFNAVLNNRDKVREIVKI